MVGGENTGHHRQGPSRLSLKLFSGLISQCLFNIYDRVLIKHQYKRPFCVKSCGVSGRCLLQLFADIRTIKRGSGSRWQGEGRLQLHQKTQTLSTRKALQASDLTGQQKRVGGFFLFVLLFRYCAVG